MNNQVAAPCCGSCDQFRWSDGKGVYICLDPEVEKQDVYYLVGTHSLPPLPDCYIPRNPIPIIQLPGMKWMIEAAYRTGFRNGWDCSAKDDDRYINLDEENNAYKYMRALEAKAREAKDE